jgi:uncharacterized protein YqeY
MLVDEMKRRMLQALKSGDEVTKEVLRVALGDIQTAEARGDKVGDEQVVAVIRKLVKSNEETLGLATDDGQKATLAKEIEVLKSFLPQTMGVEQIVAALEPVRDAIKAAGNDGQATGIAMKHLKAGGANVTGKDVTEAVKKVRA